MTGGCDLASVERFSLHHHDGILLPASVACSLHFIVAFVLLILINIILSIEGCPLKRASPCRGSGNPRHKTEMLA